MYYYYFIGNIFIYLFLLIYYVIVITVRILCTVRLLQVQNFITQLVYNILSLLFNTKIENTIRHIDIRHYKRKLYSFQDLSIVKMNEFSKEV